MTYELIFFECENMDDVYRCKNDILKAGGSVIHAELDTENEEARITVNTKSDDFFERLETTETFNFLETWRET